MKKKPHMHINFKNTQSKSQHFKLNVLQHLRIIIHLLSVRHSSVILLPRLAEALSVIGIETKTTVKRSLNAPVRRG